MRSAPGGAARLQPRVLDPAARRVQPECTQAATPCAGQAEQRIEVAFSMRRRGSTASTTLLQRAYVQNPPTNSRWSLSPKLAGVYLPLSLPYLLVDVDAQYSASIIGAPDRSILYVMARTPVVGEAVLRGLLDKVRRLGHDMAKVELVVHDGVPPPKLDVAATPPAPSAVLAE